MPFDAPFKLGPFTVDSAGRLLPQELETTPVFLFRWRGRVVRTRLVHRPEADGLALLSEVALGRVPSTARVNDETTRPRNFALLRWLVRVLPFGWRLRLTADHRIWLETETQIGLPMTAAGLLTRITCFALDLAPYLDLLDETGVSA